MDTIQLQTQIISCVKKLPKERLSIALNYLQNLIGEDRDAQDNTSQNSLTREELINFIKGKRGEPLKVIKYEDPFDSGFADEDWEFNK